MSPRTNPWIVSQVRDFQPGPDQPGGGGKREVAAEIVAAAMEVEPSFLFLGAGSPASLQDSGKGRRSEAVVS